MGVAEGDAGAATAIATLCGMTQRTLVLIKPDAVRRGLIGNVLSRF